MGQPKGCVAWNKGTRGLQEAWNKGIPCSQETIGKIRISKLGKRSKLKGTNRTPESIAKMRRTCSERPWIRYGPKGKLWTLARRKAQESFKPKPKAPIIINGKPYHPMWEDIRKKVYRRDKWLCQECGVHCYSKNNARKIQCHHIDYDIDNNVLSNLITLCASCHMKTNFKRNDWIAHYKKKIGV